MPKNRPAFPSKSAMEVEAEKMIPKAQCTRSSRPIASSGVHDLPRHGHEPFFDSAAEKFAKILENLCSTYEIEIANAPDAYFFEREAERLFQLLTVDEWWMEAFEPRRRTGTRS
jgi:hypothetical protein